MSFTISDLKKELGPGLGLRKNKYMIEIPVPGVEGRKINILCRSTSLPERIIQTTDAYYKGRRYKMRAETDFPGTYSISILDDSDMSIRQVFDAWLTLVDNTKPKDDGILGVIGNNATELGDAISGVINAFNTLKSSFEVDDGLSFLLNGITGNYGSVNYQTTVNIWQLDNLNNKVYGYQLQNAFPTTVGTVELDDSDENTLSEFSVEFTYSEFIPLKNTNREITETILGQTSTEILTGVENLFE